MIGGDHLHAAAAMASTAASSPGPDSTSAAPGRGQAGQHGAERRAPDLGAAAAAERLAAARLGQRLRRRRAGSTGARHHRAGRRSCAMKRRSIRSFQRQSQAPSSAQPPFVGHRALAPGRDQLEVVALRAESAASLPPVRAARRLCSRTGACAHRKDPGLGARRMGEMRRSRRRRRSPDRRSSASMGRRGRNPGPAQGRSRPARPAGTVPAAPRVKSAAMRRPSARITAPASTAATRAPPVSTSPPAASMRPAAPPRAPRPRAASGVCRLDQRDPARPRPQPVRDGQRQFHPADPAADHHDAGRAAGGGLGRTPASGRRKASSGLAGTACSAKPGQRPAGPR